jgi:hypothetical protein
VNVTLAHHPSRKFLVLVQFDILIGLVVHFFANRDRVERSLNRKSEPPEDVIGAYQFRWLSDLDLPGSALLNYGVSSVVSRKYLERTRRP